MEDRQRGPRLAAIHSRVAAWGAVAAASIYSLWAAHAEQIFSPGISLRTDLGSHVVAIRHLVETSLPAGLLLDWSHQWFAGYPSFYFYFPLPALLIAAASLAVPLDVAAKGLAVLAPALLPPAAYAYVRSAGFGRLHGAAAVLGVAAFLSITTHYALGGNIIASVIGEYSYSLSMALAFLYLASVQQAAHGARRLPHMALLLAGTALSHAIPTIFAVAGSTASLRSAAARRDIITGWILAFGLTAFWALPFIVRSPYMGAIAWPFEPALRALLPWPVLIIAPWAALGGAALWRAGMRPGALGALGAAAVLSYFVPHTLFAHQRGLPLVHLCIYVLTGLGIAQGLASSWAAAGRLRLAGWIAGIVALAAVIILQSDLVRRRSQLLLESSAPDSAAYLALARTLGALPAGRVHAEHWPAGGGALGDRLPPGQLPRFAASVQSTIGLLRESALTSPVYYSLLRDLSWDSAASFLRMYRAPADTSPEARTARLRRLGVDYLVTFSAEALAWAGAQTGALRELASHPRWAVWEVAGSELVSPILGVRAARGQEDVQGWLDGADETEWLFAQAGDSALESRNPGRVRPARNVLLSDRAVRFEATELGVPHIVRVGYFPNWRAYGADGPYHVVPGFMLVIPRQHAVVLRFEPTWAERLGQFLSIAAFLLTLSLIVGFFRRKRLAVHPGHAR